MSHDQVSRFFPVLNGFLRTYYPEFHQKQHPSWAMQKCQAIPQVSAFMSVDVKNPGLVPAAIAGILAGFLCGAYMSRSCSKDRGRTFIAAAYVLYGLMNVTGLVLHCFFPVDVTIANSVYVAFSALDVCCTAASCFSVVLGVLALLGYLDDRQPLPRLRFCLFLIALLVETTVVSFTCLERSQWHFINELLYFGTILMAHGAILLLAGTFKVKETLPRGALSWLALAALCCVPGWLGHAYDRYLCHYFGPHLNLVVLAYLSCCLSFLALCPFFNALCADSKSRHHKV